MVREYIKDRPHLAAGLIDVASESIAEQAERDGQKLHEALKLLNRVVTHGIQDKSALADELKTLAAQNDWAIQEALRKLEREDNQ